MHLLNLLNPEFFSIEQSLSCVRISELCADPWVLGLETLRMLQSLLSLTLDLLCFVSQVE